ncbi:putative olfactory receptor 5AK3 [Pseudophryne corroboree]|uniref:putative olfactory receptor 5AK3 n=1 Tax=Pseudophryne corroboree TaxID=495146 RepID=UPI0030815A1D
MNVIHCSDFQLTVIAGDVKSSQRAIAQVRYCKANYSFIQARGHAAGEYLLQEMADIDVSTDDKTLSPGLFVGECTLPYLSFSVSLPNLKSSVKMAQVNNTVVTEFIFLAFQELHQFQVLLFIVILLIYNTCIVGNMLIYLLIKFDLSLHTPMYFFISTFAILEIIFVSVIVPKLLDILIAGKNRISFVGCFTQMYCADTTGIVECYLLAIMVFDRHLAITNPLRYSAVMSQAYIKLAIFPWIVGFVAASVPTVFTARLEFCGSNMINHFFCDLVPLQSLACSDPFISNLVTSTTAIFVVIFPFIIIIVFYTHIIITIMKIKSGRGKYKAFSTCSSHLFVASLFFGTGIIVYVNPNGGRNEKSFALIYKVVTPLLNPFIYTLRNKDVKIAFLKNFSIISKMARGK